MPELKVRKSTAVALAYVAICVLAITVVSPVSAEEPNVGVLKIAVKYPSQVAPGSRFMMTLNVAYAVRQEARIRAALFQGSGGRLAGEIWRSEEMVVSGGGDKILRTNLTAPSSEGILQLTAYAYYFESGKWMYYNGTRQGPGIAQISIKLDNTARLSINLGRGDVPVTIDNLTERTSVAGLVSVRLPISETHLLRIPSIIPHENLTRLIFSKWSDGSNVTERTIILEGDVMLNGLYKRQYLLQVNSEAPKYRVTEWYDAESTATLQVAESVSLDLPLGLIGLKYSFKGWTGAIESGSTRINLLMNSSKVVNANFSVDYAHLMVLVIVASGIIAGLMLTILRRANLAKTVDDVHEGTLLAPTGSRKYR